MISRDPEQIAHPSQLRLRDVPFAREGVSLPLPLDVKLFFLVAHQDRGGVPAAWHLPSEWHDIATKWTYKPALCGATPPQAWGNERHWLEEDDHMLYEALPRLCLACAAKYGFDRATLSRLRRWRRDTTGRARSWRQAWDGEDALLPPPDLILAACKRRQAARCEAIQARAPASRDLAHLLSYYSKGGATEAQYVLELDTSTYR